jgi:predicted Zn-dependent protease
MKDQPILSRRDFLILSGTATASVLTGCATNPVTGRSQFMLMSEAQEVEADQSQAPHQFSADYGSIQVPALNAYVAEVGNRVSGISHRAAMPYSYRALNAVNVNAYTFPAGSMAVTRGILLSMQDESELAAVLGHEIGHVNYRHTASRMSKAIMTQLVLLAAVGAVSYKYKKYTTLAAGLGALGSGLLLANYSRADERQADEYGQEFMVKAGYHPDGMVHLMERLVELQKVEPSAMEVMFSSHPMSAERYDAAILRATTTYAGAREQKINRERYMDMTAPIRAQKDAILAMQNGLEALGENKIPEAEKQYQTALALQPHDYAGLLTMAKIQLAQNKVPLAREYANRARDVYPEEPQARQVCALAALNQKQFDSAFADFDAYDRMLPGNANLAFFKGYCLEQMGRKEASAGEFKRFLESGAEDEQAVYARDRLVSWGYIQQPAAEPAATDTTAATKPAKAAGGQNPKKKKKKANP